MVEIVMEDRLIGLCSCTTQLQLFGRPFINGFRIQHGDNPECSREFEDLMISAWLPPSQILSHEGVRRWLSDVHARDAR